MTEQQLLAKQAELVAFAQGAGNPITEALAQIAQLTLNWANDSISGDDMRRAINNISISTQLAIHDQYLPEPSEVENNDGR